MEHPETGLIIHAMNVVDRAGRHIQRNPNMTKFEHGWIADRIIQRGGRWRSMPTSALCFRRDVAAHVFPIPEETFRRCQDGFIFTLLPLFTKVSTIDEPLSSYRVHGQNIFAVRRLDVTHAITEVNYATKQIHAVNERLKNLGLPGEILDIQRNLGYQKSSFLVAVFQQTPRWRLIRAYARLLAALFADDLYSFPQKCLGLIAYGGAVVLPSPLRSRWLSLALEPNSIRGGVQKIMRKIRGMGRQEKRFAT